MAESERNEPDLVGRRRFLERLSLGLTGLGSIIIGVPFIGSWLEPILHGYPTAWRTVGNVDNFTIGITTEVSFLDANPLPWTGVGAINGAWLRRDSATSFTAFTIYCQHLGCPVRWNQAAELFLCPCHGGVYYANGTVAAGPPPRALPTYPVRVVNGQVQVLATGVPYTY
ncbi:MAG: (2Fe-2S)-binding protein [Chloroflexi bacterium]|nr:(2Fe-2S)-binding protein [Chloroflexota bacterium]